MIGLIRRTPTELAGREPSAAELFDTHVHDLLALAFLLLDDHHDAEVVVAQVLREACAQLRSSDDRGDRRALACDVHRRCFSARTVKGNLLFRIATETDPSPMDRGLVTLSDQQRSVIGMCLFGGHTHAEAAQFLALPIWVVDELLRSGLHRLSKST